MSVVKGGVEPARQAAIIKYLAIYNEWMAKIYTTKGLPHMATTEDVNELGRIESTGTMMYNDGTLQLMTSLRCAPYTRTKFYYWAYTDHGYGIEKLSVPQLKKMLSTLNKSR